MTEPKKVGILLSEVEPKPKPKGRPKLDPKKITRVLLADRQWYNCEGFELIDFPGSPKSQGYRFEGWPYQRSPKPGMRGYHYGPISAILAVRTDK